MTSSPAERAAAERAEQGLPEVVEDDLIYERVATVLRNVDTPRSARRKKAS